MRAHALRPVSRRCHRGLLLLPDPQKARPCAPGCARMFSSSTCMSGRRGMAANPRLLRALVPRAPREGDACETHPPAPGGRVRLSAASHRGRTQRGPWPPPVLPLGSGRPEVRGESGGEQGGWRGGQRGRWGPPASPAALRSRRDSGRAPGAGPPSRGLRGPVVGRAGRGARRLFKLPQAMPTCGRRPGAASRPLSRESPRGWGGCPCTRAPSPGKSEPGPPPAPGGPVTAPPPRLRVPRSAEEFPAPPPGTTNLLLSKEAGQSVCKRFKGGQAHSRLTRP